jgi:hypothetical protein
MKIHNMITNKLTLPKMTLVLLTAGFASSANAATLLQVDLFDTDDGVPGDSQAGWDAFGAHGNSTSVAVPVTAAGTIAGITVTLGDVGNWESRGGSDDNRFQVTGTSFDDVVENFWATRDSAITISFTGLQVGGSYTLEAWHNDSFTPGNNGGFANGGGIITPTVSVGTIIATSTGTQTNLGNTQTDGAFDTSLITFTATSSDPTVTLTSTNVFGYLLINGATLTAIPEPSTTALLGLGGLALILRRRK